MQQVQQMTPTATRRPAQRACAGCGHSDAQSELIRLVLDGTGALVVDLARKSYGRGAWVHPSTECLSKAVPRGLSRALKARVSSDLAHVLTSMRAAAERRAEGLLLAARGGSGLALGGAAVKEALEADQARLVIVAQDAQAAAQTPEIVGAIGRGLAVSWATKARLGQLLNRGDVAVVAVTNHRIATELSKTIGMIYMPEPELRSRRHTGTVREDG